MQCRALPWLLLAVVASGCLTRTEGPGPRTGTVDGRVMAGPTCPVVQAGEPECSDAPVVGTVELWTGDRLGGSVTIGVDGRFTAGDVPVGSYVARIRVDGPFPTCPETPVEVTAEGTTTVEIACDTGIR